MSWLSRIRAARAHDEALTEDAQRQADVARAELHEARVTAQAIGVLLAPNNLAIRTRKAFRGEAC